MSAQKSRIKLEWVRTHPSTAICRQLEPITQAYRLPLPTVFHFGCGVSLICSLASVQVTDQLLKRNTGRNLKRNRSNFRIHLSGAFTEQAGGRRKEGIRLDSASRR